LRAGGIQIETGKAKVLETRRSVVRSWLGVRDILRASSREELAREVERFIIGMPAPHTEREWVAQALQVRAREARQQILSDASR
jgi:hypothetical protein